jgi:hypothetical protein
VHIAGERLFVDFAGHTMEVIDAATGEVRCAEVFVAVLGASSFLYAEATWSQALADSAFCRVPVSLKSYTKRTERPGLPAPSRTYARAKAATTKTLCLPPFLPTPPILA